LLPAAAGCWLEGAVAAGGADELELELELAPDAGCVAWLGGLLTLIVDPLPAGDVVVGASERGEAKNTASAMITTIARITPTITPVEVPPPPSVEPGDELI
jgi:hypothetical protein